MNESRTPNYGLDAPLVVRNMLIVRGAGDHLADHAAAGRVVPARMTSR